MFIRSLQSGGRDRQGKIGRKELYAPWLWGWDLYRPNISHLTTSWTGWIKSGRNWPLSGRKDSWTIISYLQHKADQRHKQCICFLGMVQRFCALAQVADSYGRHPVIRASLAANFRYCRRQQGSVCRIWVALEYDWIRKITRTVREGVIDGKLYLMAYYDDVFINIRLVGVGKNSFTARSSNHCP